MTSKKLTWRCMTELKPSQAHHHARFATTRVVSCATMHARLAIVNKANATE